jgi:hypothetical protein
MNLFSDRWIPVTTIEGQRIVPFSNLISPAGFEVLSIDCHLVSRMAIIRLAMAWKAWADRTQVVGQKPLDLVHRDWFDLATAFQVGGLPESSARSAQDIIDMTDGNGVAWSPLPAALTTEADLAMALVTAAFCDRGGLKARVEGLPISAQTPLHVGQRVGLKRGGSIGELLENNPVKYESDYQPPWVTGMVYPEHKTPRDELELLLWPWRRLQIFGSGITIAPGAPIDKSVVDPWCIEKASLKHLNNPAEDDREVTALVMNQAMPVACWIC